MATSGLDFTIAKTVVAGMAGQATFTAFGGTTNAKLKLMSTAASETADGTEINGGSYTTGGITFARSSTWGSPAYSAPNASVTNSGAAITQTGMPTVTVTYASIWDTGTTPARWWWGQLTTAVGTNSGDTLTFATSSVVVNLAV
jgi:hypothetical protein